MNTDLRVGLRVYGLVLITEIAWLESCCKAGSRQCLEISPQDESASRAVLQNQKITAFFLMSGILITVIECYCYWSKLDSALQPEFLHPKPGAG